VACGGHHSNLQREWDSADPNNYRSITVGHVLGKLYALLLNLRLSTWTETEGKRALGQSGFRRGFRITDSCFTMQALARPCPGHQALHLHRGPGEGL
jgi:hypothetical protein